MASTINHLSKEAVGLVQDVLKLDEVHEVLLKCFFIAIDLFHFSFQQLKFAFQIQHLCRKNFMKSQLSQNMLNFI